MIIVNKAKNIRLFITVVVGAAIGILCSVSFMAIVLFPTALLEIPNDSNVYLEFPMNNLMRYSPNEKERLDEGLSDFRLYSYVQLGSETLCTFAHVPFLGSNGRYLQIEVCLDYQ